jgi:esterase
MRLHFERTGNGPSLLVLHGFLGSLDNWRSFGQRLAPHFSVIRLDLRNHGRSPHAPDMTYPLMAQDIAEFIDEHNIGSAHILGHSMGGKVAMEFAASYTDKVRSVIVVDIAPRAYAAAHEELLNTLAALDLSAFRSFAEIDGALGASIPSLATRQFLLKNIGRAPDNGFYWRLNLPAIRQNYRALTEPVVVRRAVMRRTCFIRGGRSDYITEDDLPLIRSAFPEAEIRTIEDAGHWVHADAPAEFDNIVTEFLSRAVM